MRSPRENRGADKRLARPCTYSVSLTSSTRSKKHSILRKSSNLRSLPLIPL